MRTRIRQVLGNVSSKSYEAEDRPIIEDFLQPTLCTVVSEIRHSRHDLPLDLDSQLRKQRAAALKSRWEGRSFTGLAWLDE